MNFTLNSTAGVIVDLNNCRLFSSIQSLLCEACGSRRMWDMKRMNLTGFILFRVQKEAEACIRQYNSRCIKPFARQYINIMLRGPSRSLKEKCNNKKGIEGESSSNGKISITKTLFLDLQNI